MEYQVTWTIDIEADSPTQAAVEAQRIQRDPESIATVFTVKQGDGSCPEEVIDLAEETPELSSEPTLSLNAIYEETLSYFECPKCAAVNEVPAPMPGWRVTCEHCKSAYMLTK